MIVSPTGEPLAGAATPPSEQTLEYPLDPKITGELKAAVIEDSKFGNQMTEYAVGFLVMLSDALRIVEQKRKYEAEVQRLEKRAQASSGINLDQIRGIDLDRGMLKYVKKVK